MPQLHNQGLDVKNAFKFPHIKPMECFSEIPEYEAVPSEISTSNKN